MSSWRRLQTPVVALSQINHKKSPEFLGSSGLFYISLQSGNHPIGGTEVQIGKEGTAACYSRPQYQAIKVFTLQVPICNEQERRLRPLPSTASWLHPPLCGRDR